MKVLLMYPPGKLYQRGEDRCQSNISSSTATTMRAANDLGYASSIIDSIGHESFIRDYQTENYNIDNFYKDVKKIKPDIILMSITNATIYTDIEIINSLLTFLKYKPTIILKGSIFYDASKDMLDLLDLSNIDILIGGEIEFVIGNIVKAISNKKSLKNINNIFYKSNKKWIKNEFKISNINLDTIPFPNRKKMNNKLYVRPDTNEIMATIQTSRGCPSRCIYCLTPIISGKCVRFRTTKNVFAEIEECYYKYNIRNFFFKADTFTIDPKWTIELCDLIINSPLYKKIEFTVNSRVKPISYEVLKKLKEAGCFTIAYGFETGNKETMHKICKGVTIEDNIKAMKMTKDVGIPVFGFFMIGFPWENKKHIKDTKKMIYKLNADFIELHIALPYYGTKLYDICNDENTLQKNILGSDYFEASTTGTKYLNYNKLLKIRKKIIKTYYIRPSYIIKKLWEVRKNPTIIKNYIKQGIKVVFK